MKGMITACFLLTNTLGNFVNMGWTRFYGGSLDAAPMEQGKLPPGEFFGLTAAMPLFAAVVFIFVGKWFERSAARKPETPTEGLPA